MCRAYGMWSRMISSRIRSRSGSPGGSFFIWWNSRIVSARRSACGETGALAAPASSAGSAFIGCVSLGSAFSGGAVLLDGATLLDAVFLDAAPLDPVLLDAALLDAVPLDALLFDGAAFSFRESCCIRPPAWPASSPA